MSTSKYSDILIKIIFIIDRKLFLIKRILHQILNMATTF